MNKIQKIITGIIFILAFAILTTGIRGAKDNPIAYQNSYDTSLGGPFELSNSTSRYALVVSIVKNRSFFLNKDLAQFASPDVTFNKDKFTTIFTPGVSLLGVPLYMLGDKLGVPQLSTYFLNIIFGILNVFIVAKISRKLGSNLHASVFAGFVFLFATNAFAFAFGFTQHHVSTFLILTAVLLSSAEVTWINSLLLGLVLGAGVLVDVPNAVMITPTLIYFFTKSFSLKNLKSGLVSVVGNMQIILFVFGIVPMVLLFGWYNKTTTGSYTTLAQSLGRTRIFAVVDQGRNSVDGHDITPQKEPTKRSITLPFNSRNALNGFYTLVLSDERSWVVFSPVIFMGIVGFWFSLKGGNKGLTVAVIGTILLNIVMYTMFSDPWGGWSFGARYLIPGAALMATGVGVFLSKNKNKILLLLFFVLLIYSLGVNILGALTTNALPPKVEAINLPKPLPYTYLYNWQLINSGQATSLFYNLYLSKIVTPIVYMYVYGGFVGLVFVLLSVNYFIERKKNV